MRNAVDDCGICLIENVGPLFKHVQNKEDVVCRD